MRCRECKRGELVAVGRSLHWGWMLCPECESGFRAFSGLLGMKTEQVDSHLMVFVLEAAQMLPVKYDVGDTLDMRIIAIHSRLFVECIHMRRRLENQVEELPPDIAYIADLWDRARAQDRASSEKMESSGYTDERLRRGMELSFRLYERTALLQAAMSEMTEMLPIEPLPAEHAECVVCGNRGSYTSDGEDSAFEARLLEAGLTTRLCTNCETYLLVDTADGSTDRVRPASWPQVAMMSSALGEIRDWETRL
jgi:hypothetical protein